MFYMYLRYLRGPRALLLALTCMAVAAAAGSTGTSSNGLRAVVALGVEIALVIVVGTVLSVVHRRRHRAEVARDSAEAAAHPTHPLSTGPVSESAGLTWGAPTVTPGKAGPSS